MYTAGLSRYDSPYGTNALREINSRHTHYKKSIQPPAYKNEQVQENQTQQTDSYKPQYSNQSKNTTKDVIATIGLMILSGVAAYKGKNIIQKGIGHLSGAGSTIASGFKKHCPNLSQAFTSFGKACASPFNFLGRIFHK